MTLPQVEENTGSGQVYKNFYWIIAFATAVLFVVILCSFFDPLWETNDDVTMSMIAHGYGIAAFASPKLVFSNVVWGYFVQALPEIDGILGYSLATLLVSVIVSIVFIYSLLKAHFHWVSCVAVLVLLMLRPVLFPQFTINAGLLMVSAILCWNNYAKDKDRKWVMLILGCVLAVLSYLVRSQEALLVFLIGLPLLPWQLIWQDTSVKIAGVVLGITIVIAGMVNHKAYQSEEWNEFNALNLPRAAYTDFGVGKLLQTHPEVMAKFGYSANDVALIQNWFFLDNTIADPQKLQAMADEVKQIATIRSVLINGWIAVNSLLNTKILILMLTGLLLLALSAQWKIAFSWGMCLSAIMMLGMLGRPGIMRVYIPLFTLLILSPCLMVQLSQRRKQIRAAILFIAAFVMTVQVLKESIQYTEHAHKIQKNLASFPSHPIVIWGANFPFEKVFPVLHISPEAKYYRFSGLGTMTKAPYSWITHEEKAGRSLLNQLASDQGLFIIALEPKLHMLSQYCEQHYQGELKQLSTEKFGDIVVTQQQCITNNKNASTQNKIASSKGYQDEPR